MARLILLSLKDNDAAEQLVKDLWRLQVAEHIAGHEMAELGTLVACYTNVEWMLARPMASCKCTGHAKNRQWGWAKTKRFGWWVHATCNRCSRMVVQNFVKNLMNGHNDLLPELRQSIDPPAPPEVGAQESPQEALTAEGVTS